MSRKTGGMLSSAARSSPATDADVGAHWRTPPDLADAIRVAFGLAPWALDLAATRESSLAPAYFGPDHEDPERRDTLGLRLTVGDLYGSGPDRLAGPVWCNPPYSRQGIDRWMQLCAKLGRPGRPVVALVFARTDCEWFHERALSGAEQILFIKGRVPFIPPFDTEEQVCDWFELDAEQRRWVNASTLDTTADCERLALGVGKAAARMLRTVRRAALGKLDAAGAPSMAILWRHPPAVARSPWVGGLSWR